MTVRGYIRAWQRVIAVATMAIALAPSSALSQSDSTTGRINARIAQPVALNNTVDMSFGWLARPANAGIAQLMPANRMVSTGLALVKLDGSSPAKIVITGSPNQAVGLLVGDMARFKGKNSKVAVSGFTHNGGPMPALGPDGRATIELGATLHLAANARNGRYRGVFDVIVSNN